MTINITDELRSTQEIIFLPELIGTPIIKAKNICSLSLSSFSKSIKLNCAVDKKLFCTRVNWYADNKSKQYLFSLSLLSSVINNYRTHRPFSLALLSSIYNDVRKTHTHTHLLSLNDAFHLPSSCFTGCCFYCFYRLQLRCGYSIREQWKYFRSLC
jgi:hypothetical protein